MKTLKEYKDKEKAKAYKLRHKSKNYKKGDFGEGLSKFTIYSEGECKLILEHKQTDRELARTLGRSTLAIQVKRSKLLNNYVDPRIKFYERLKRDN